MELFEGLNAKQRGALRHGSSYQQMAKGEILFSEGDPAARVYMIVSGAIEIYRKTSQGEIPFVTRGPDEIVGEMGIVSESRTRTAAARAVEPTTLLSLPRDPVEFFTGMNDEQAATILLKNLVGVLAAKLQKTTDDHTAPASELAKVAGYETNPEDVLKRVENLLPRKGIFYKVVKISTLKPGEFLCRQGEESDGFFYLHAGTVSVVKTDDAGQTQNLARRSSPALLGKSGFLKNARRGATLIAETPLSFTHFSRRDFEALEKTSPEDARTVLYAVAMWLIMAIYDAGQNPG